MPLLEISQLHKSFGKQKAVNNISLKLEKGEIRAILGESGSGKTTLLQLIAGLEEPDSGKLLLEGKAITPPSEKLIAGHPDIKLVKQDYGLFPNISLRENIAYELRFYEEGYKNKRVDKLLKLGGLWNIQNHLPRQVSGGEQQRTVILRSLAEQPKLLLLDEPFSHLDSRNKRKLKQEIQHIIKDEGVSCIFVTHEVADAYGIADKISVMQNGKFLRTDFPEKLYQSPINRYVAEMTGDVALKAIEKGKTAHQNIDLQLLRPHQIILNEASESKAIVRNTSFMGAFYEIEIEIDDIHLKMLSSEKLSIGEIIGIKFKI